MSLVLLRREMWREDKPLCNTWRKGLCCLLDLLCDVWHWDETVKKVWVAVRLFVAICWPDTRYSCVKASMLKIELKDRRYSPKHTLIRIPANIRLQARFAVYISGFNCSHTPDSNVSDASAWMDVCEWDFWVYYVIPRCLVVSLLLTRPSGIYVMQLLYRVRFNMTEKDFLLFDSHRVKKQETLQRYVLRHLTGDGCKYWETEKGVSKHWKLHEYLSLSLPVVVLFFPVIPKPISLTGKTSAVLTHCCLHLPAAKQR